MRILLLLLLASPLFADGPLFQQKDPYLQQEIQNIYHDLKYPNIVAGKASTMTITNLPGISLGKVRQVVSATSTTAFTTTSTSFLITNLLANITPTSATSTMLIMASGTLADNTGSVGTKVAATLSGTAMGNLTSICENDLGIAAGTYIGIVPCTMTYLDSPGTTAQQTYGVKIKVSAGTTTAQWGTAGTLESIVIVEIGS